jgi:hypothetical protein
MYQIIEEKRKERLNKLDANNFHPSNIIATMGHLYAQGAEDMDDIWRNVVMEYLNEIGKEPKEFMKILAKVTKAK